MPISTNSLEMPEVLKRSLLTALFLLFTLALPASELRARMEARLPAINQLKAEGIIGENNKGLLAFVGDVKKMVKLIEAHNADRLKGYQVVAAKQGVDVAQISLVRADIYAKRAKSGHWIQKKNGSWVQKP